MPDRDRPDNRDGFSLVEALLAVTVTAVAGGALLTSLGAAVRTTTDATHRAIAAGLTHQLMDEIAAAGFPEGDSDVPSGNGRSGFDDIDDYHRWSASPPVDRDGVEIGTEGHRVLSFRIARLQWMRPDPEFLSQFTRVVDVERVEPDDSGGWTTTTSHTDYRRVTVRVDYTDALGNAATLAETTRIFGNVSYTP